MLTLCHSEFANIDLDEDQTKASLSADAVKAAILEFQNGVTWDGDDDDEFEG